MGRKVKNTVSVNKVNESNTETNREIENKTYKYWVHYDFNDEVVTCLPGTDKEFKHSMLDLEFDSLEESKEYDVSKHDNVNIPKGYSYLRVIKLFNPKSLVFDVIERKKLKIKE